MTESTDSMLGEMASDRGSASATNAVDATSPRVESTGRAQASPKGGLIVYSTYGVRPAVDPVQRRLGRHIFAPSHNREPPCAACAIELAPLCEHYDPQEYRVVADPEAPEPCVWTRQNIDDLDVEIEELWPVFDDEGTVVFAGTSDPFAPSLVESGETLRVLLRFLARTTLNLVIVTRNADCGSDKWASLLASVGARVKVTIPVGTIDESALARFEPGTSSVEARVAALHALHAEGVEIFALVSPLYPDMLRGDGIERLLDRVRVHMCRDVYVEPCSIEMSRSMIEAGPTSESAETTGFSGDREMRIRAAHSAYIAESYRRVRAIAEHEGWVRRLKFLVNESDIADADVDAFGDHAGLVLLGATDAGGLSRDRRFNAVQRRCRAT